MLASDEVVVDNFAGGGGASTALADALGRDPEEAINHDPIAIAMHKANHPRTRHWCQNIWQVDPRAVAERRPIGIGWFSPDCTHHSKAKGGKPLENGRRDLAWVVVSWAKTVSPRIIFLENVEEFADWGPLVDGRPCPDRKGQTFKRFVRELRRLGYEVEWDELRACDFGAPTTRKRLFMVARRDGAPIKWPEPTHARGGAPGLLPWRTAAEVIDWNISCPSIFLSRQEARAIGCKRPLADNTMARIAAGVKRYVIDAADPFVVNLTHHGADRNESLREPMRTLTAAHRGEKALIAPVVTYAQQGGAVRDPLRPLHTITASNKDQNSIIAAHLTKFRDGAIGTSAREPVPTVTANSFIKRPGGAPPMGVVSAFLAQHTNNRGVDPHPGHDARVPMSTITSQAQQGIVAAHMLNLKGSDRRDRSVEEPVNAICSGGQHIAEVRAFLVKYYGAQVGQHQEVSQPIDVITSKARFGIVTIEGVDWQIVDIGMRMLTPRELFRAQGFPDTYIIDRWTKTAQISACGNSVSPPPATALVRANVLEAPRMRRLKPTPLEARIAA